MKNGDHKIHDFREALRIFRVKSGFTQQQLASKLGTDREMVKEWEIGHLTPSPLYLKRLYDVLPNLRYVTDYLPKLVKDQLMQRAHAVGTEGKQLWIPPSPTPSDLPVPPDLLQMDFGQTLSVSMQEEGITADDIKAVLDLPDAAYVDHWQNNSRKPTESQYKTLLDLFPQLEDAPPPGKADVTLPPIVEKLAEPELIVVPAPPTPPPIPPAPTPKPQTQVVPYVAPKKYRSKVDIAGVEHANSLLALQHAKLHMADLVSQISDLKSEISILEEGVRLSEKKLLDTVRNAAEEELD